MPTPFGDPPSFGGDLTRNLKTPDRSREVRCGGCALDLTVSFHMRPPSRNPVETKKVPYGTPTFRMIPASPPRRCPRSRRRR